MGVLFNLLFFLPILLFPAALLAMGVAAASRRLTGRSAIPFAVVFILGSILTLYYLLLDYQAGLKANLKYLVFSEERLAEEDIFLPSTIYWRAIFSGNDSEKIFRSIVEKKFDHKKVDEIVQYLKRSRLTCSGPFKEPANFSCEYLIDDRPAISPFWRINLEFDDSGAFSIPYITQFFQLAH
jgi:hypothetical protein